MFSLIVMMSEAFAVVREAARRKLGMRHFDVQVSLSLFTNSPFGLRGLARNDKELGRNGIFLCLDYKLG